MFEAFNSPRMNCNVLKRMTEREKKTFAQLSRKVQVGKHEKASNNKTLLLVILMLFYQKAEM